MSAATGIIGGALALATLQLVLSSRGATSAYGAVATGPASWLEKFMDASVAAIPDHSITAPSPPASSGSAPSSAATGYIPSPSSLPPASTPTTLSV